MFELRSETLTEYYGAKPEDYDIGFVHFNIDIKNEDDDEYELLERDLYNIKNYIGNDQFKIYFSTNSDVYKVVNNTNIFDEFSDFIYIRLRNNTEYNEVKSILNNKKSKFVISLDNLDIIDSLNETDEIILDVDNISDLSSDELIELASKYNIKKVNLGQIGYLVDYYELFLDNMGVKFNVPKDKNVNTDYNKIEKNIIISNDLYSLKEYIEIEQELIKLQDGINENDTDAEKFIKIYKNIINKIDYNFAGLDSEEIANQNMLGGLFDNKCVCEGFTKILQQSLSLVGIESIVVGGNGSKSEGGHLWNQVKINDKWYNADAASDSIGRSNNKHIDFCLVSDDGFNSDSLIAKRCDESFDLKNIGKEHTNI